MAIFEICKNAIIISATACIVGGFFILFCSIIKTAINVIFDNKKKK